jgi:hypothetical protein
MKFITLFPCLVLLQAGLAAESKPPTVEASSDCRKSITLAETLEVHEGLPHQTTEKALFEKEIKRGDVAEIGNYPFYTPGVLATNAAELKRILSDSATIETHKGAKRCGGFHPDYGITWKAEGKTCHALVCFGCGEIVFHDGKTSFTYDSSDEAEGRLKKLLSVYAKNRPFASVK